MEPKPAPRVTHPQQVHEGAAATAALHALGALTQENLLESVEWGLRHALDCTSHETPNVPGIIAWGKNVRALRDRLVPNKWTPNDAKNYSTVVSPTGTDAMAVAAGNHGTGRADKQVATRSSKGPMTREKIGDNQLTLFDSVAQQFPSPEPLSDVGVRTCSCCTTSTRKLRKCGSSFPCRSGLTRTAA